MDQTLDSKIKNEKLIIATTFQKRAEHILGRATKSGSVRSMGKDSRTALIDVGYSLLIMLAAAVVFFIPVIGWLLSILLGGFAVIYFLMNISVIIYSALGTAVTPLRKTIDLTCPFCDEDTTILHKAKKYRCSNCQKLVWINGDQTDRLIKFNCQYCKSEYAVSDRNTKFRCINCGTTHEISDGRINKVLIESVQCAKCDAAIDENAYYCNSCFEMANTDFADILQVDSLLQRSGKTPLGHFIHAMAIARNLSNNLSKNVLAGDLLSESQEMLNCLTVVFESLEEALEDKNLKCDVIDSMSFLDTIYAQILSKVYFENEQYKIYEAANIADRWSRREDNFSTLVKLPFIDNRIAVIQKLERMDSELSAESFKVWNKDLVKLENDLFGGASGNTSLYRVSDLEKLETEIEQLGYAKKDLTDHLLANLNSIFEMWQCCICDKNFDGVRIPYGYFNKVQNARDRIMFLLPPPVDVSKYENAIGSAEMIACEHCGAKHCKACLTSMKSFLDDENFYCRSCGQLKSKGATLINFPKLEVEILDEDSRTKEARVEQAKLAPSSERSD